MPNLFDIIVAFLDDSKKSPEMKEYLRDKYNFWSDGMQIISPDVVIIDTLGHLFARLGADGVAVGKYGENEGEYSGCYYLEVC